MTDTREFKLSGGALSKSRKSTRKNQKGGDNSGALMQLAGQSTTDVANPDVQQLASGFASTVSQAMATSLGPNKIQQFGGKQRGKQRGQQSGGDISAMAVNQASTRAPTVPGSPPPTPVVSGISPSQARKIHIRVKGVTSRLAKAKRAKKIAMSAPLSQVKAKLESASVIKKGSKAPEHMLRNMYADLLITKKGL